jgi:hypothetical protein
VFNRTYHVRARPAAIGKLIAEGILKTPWVFLDAGLLCQACGRTRITQQQPLR